MKNYIMKEENGKMYFSPVKLLEKPSMIKIVDNKVRIDILKMLNEKAMYPAEIAKKLKMHEQIVYYHLKQLTNAELIIVVERKEIRGTIAKKLASKVINFAVTLDDDWKSMESFSPTIKDKKIESFFDGFVVDGELDGKFVVGSPDQHGPYKARARDSHYAIDLSLFVGSLAKIGKDFPVKLDVEVNFPSEDSNFILVGGPATNLIVSLMNKDLPVLFNESKPWEMVSQKSRKRYSEETVGMIVKVPNPHFPNRKVIIIAGISSSGTKSAVIALTRHYKELLKGYNGQETWSAIVQGFDVDGDGKVDSVEILE